MFPQRMKSCVELFFHTSSTQQEKVSVKYVPTQGRYQLDFSLRRGRCVECAGGQYDTRSTLVIKCFVYSASVKQITIKNDAFMFITLAS